MAFEIISKLKRERLIMVAVIILLFFFAFFTNVYYNNKIQQIQDCRDKVCSENYAEVPTSPIVKGRKDKKKW